MKRVNLFGAKGGVGTTTITAAMALEMSKRHIPTTVACAADIIGPPYVHGSWQHELLCSDRNALAAVLGLGMDAKPGQEVAPGLFFHDPGNEEKSFARAVITDFGTYVSHVGRYDGDYNILVVRNEYLGLRRAITSEQVKQPNGSTQLRFDGFVLVEEEGRALGLREVRDVLGLPHLATIPVEPTIGRAIDAGVLPTRVPEKLAKPVSQIVDSIRASVMSTP